MNNDYHDTPQGPDLAETSIGPLSVTDDGTIQAHQAKITEFSHMMAFGGRQSGRNWAVLNWARGIARMFDMNRSRAAAAAHLSREASRYSTAPEPKSVDHMMAVYARQRGTSPTRLRPNLTPAQGRRLRKKRNRMMKGTVAA
jgi:hypothetical protein